MSLAHVYKNFAMDTKLAKAMGEIHRNQNQSYKCNAFLQRKKQISEKFSLWILSSLEGKSLWLLCLLALATSHLFTWPVSSLFVR